MNTQNLTAKKSITIRPASIKELADMYEMDRKTMARWLKPHLGKIGERIGWYYNVRQMEIIFEVLGFPPCFDNT